MGGDNRLISVDKTDENFGKSCVNAHTSNAIFSLLSNRAKVGNSMLIQTLQKLSI